MYIVALVRHNRTLNILDFLRFHVCDVSASVPHRALNQTVRSERERLKTQNLVQA